MATEREPLLSSVSSLKSPASTAPTQTLNQVTKAKLIWILAALWSAVFLGAVDGTIVATLQQPIGEYFQQSHIASYVGTSYLLSVCCFTPLYGRLADILGRKGAMLLALSLFTLGTLLCGCASSMNGLIAARAIAGMGGGGVLKVSSITVTDLVPLRKRGLFQGISNLLYGVGSGLGGPLGGYICDNFGWRSAFLIQVPFLIVSWILVFIHVDVILRTVPLTLKQKLKRIDWLGSLTLFAFIAPLLAGFSFKATEDLAWKNPRVWGLISASGVAFFAFVFVEAKVSSEPVMPMGLLLSRTPLAISLTNFFGSIVCFSLVYNVPLYFMAVRLQSPSEAGLQLVPNSLAMSVGSIAVGWIIWKTGRYWALTMTSTAISLLGTVLMALWNRKTSNIELWFAIIAVFTRLRTSRRKNWSKMRI